MNTDCKVPDLMVMESTNLSTSGDSSISLVSSFSKIKDSSSCYNLEEDILNTSQGKGSNKRKYKYKRKSKIRSSSSNSGFSDGRDAGLFPGKGVNRGKSFDSDVSAVSWVSQISHTGQCPEVGYEYSSFAEQLADRILQESFQTLFRDGDDQLTTGSLDRNQSAVCRNTDDFADNLASDVINMAFQCLYDMHTSGELHLGRNVSMATPQSTQSQGFVGNRVSRSTSDEYADAPDVPYMRLEYFADELANRVIKHSVNVYNREIDNQTRVGCTYFRHSLVDLIFMS